MDMILARFCFVDLDTLIFAQLSEHLSDILFDLSVYDLSPVFRRKYDMIMEKYDAEQLRRLCRCLCISLRQIGDALDLVGDE